MYIKSLTIPSFLHMMKMYENVVPRSPFSLDTWLYILVYFYVSSFDFLIMTFFSFQKFMLYFLYTLHSLWSNFIFSESYPEGFGCGVMFVWFSVVHFDIIITLFNVLTSKLFNTTRGLQKFWHMIYRYVHVRCYILLSKPSRIWLSKINVNNPLFC